jgi:hypothetical protein
MAPPSTRASIAVLALFATAACGIVSPSCHEERGPVLDAAALLSAGTTTDYTVVSPKNSNLLIRLTWSDAEATLQLRATITDCGRHVGCVRETVTPAPGPGGPSPTQPWPPGLREMVVDGTFGKTYLIDVVADPARDAAFTLAVSYLITCES